MNEGDPSRAVLVAALLASALLTGGSTAQVIVTASAPVAGTFQAAAGGNVVSAPLAVGSVAPGTFGSASALVTGTTAAWDLAPTSIGTAAFEVESLSSALSFAATVSSSGQFTLDVRLQSSSGAVENGVLVLEAGRLSLGGGSASVLVDVGADGTFEVGSSDSEVLVPLTVTTQGVTVRIEMSSTAAAGAALGLAGSGEARLRGEFVPGRGYLERFAALPTLVYLEPELVAVDRWSLELSSPLVALSPFVTVLGFQPTHLPLGPGLVQLVTVDAVLLGGSFVFDLPPLPAGFDLYAQGVVTDGAGAFATSNSVRIHWW
jgi:hypothetical protein